MNPDTRRTSALPPPPELPGTHIDVELALGARLSLRRPTAQALGGGTCKCEALTAQLTNQRRQLLRERVFGGEEDLLRCLFPPAETATSAAGPIIDEFAVDLGEPDAPDLPDATLPEDAEYLGSYSSVQAYLRAMLEPEVTPACAWILAHLDYAAIQRRWESDGSRLVRAHGHVYRLATSGSALR